ncbi:ABC transporter ATP-binding protein/permease [Staphylococcus arlettae]|uniref:ABC transporter ATP-binding protein/permease n=1 Tax=Staphylococcus arlettae TaxID=29378 RepID=UPI000D1B7503|nr:ABC transporter ATP-binding protein/permease [Staphylococcus arlettae]MBF0736589.1 ABC transporter ATP-binding protein/permease [Staphylococcus arlettae]PTH66832.1 cysteine ABC transporter ATP-binding protein [Staphylococcus arlettae]RIM73646.1 ABC transporter ATP-binding protein/permease [Staphylococcus arlettae]RIM81791.1 ABC transporter ATP-binding protein/permease [Staphylococcus arlettae]TFU48716.1 ABC transporter ATP-binding protein/permease [Staphylococcus arlettae]
MKRLTKLALEYKIFPILMFLVSILLALTVVFQNITIGVILDKVLIQQQFQLTSLLIIIFFVLIARAVFNMLNLAIGDTMANRIKNSLRQQVIEKASKSPIGKQINVVTEGIDGIAPFFSNFFPQVFKSMMIPVFIIGAMFFIHLNTALIMLVTAPFIPLFYIIFGLETRDESKDKMAYLNQFSQQFLNKVKGLITLKLFNQTARTEQELYEESTHFRTLTMRILKSAFLSGLMLEFITMLGIGLVALEAGLGLILFNNIDFKTAAIAIILAPEFYNAIKDLGQSFHSGKQSEGSSDVVFDFLEESTINPIARPQQHDMSTSSVVKLNDVSFKYEDAQSYALQHINLEITKGEKIALVGPSGAGKSTLAQIITQQLPVTNGELTVASRQLRFGILSQAPYIFNTSIKNNITMFNDEITEAQVYKMLNLVGLKEKVAAFKDGIDTHIGEGGEMLSGGEMRRIELSRVLLLQPDIVLFDEPTTGLDLQTETIIQDVIHRQFQAATIIYIAHRDSTIQYADRRVYIENGSVKFIDKVMSVENKKGGEPE